MSGKQCSSDPEQTSYSALFVLACIQSEYLEYIMVRVFNLFISESKLFLPNHTTLSMMGKIILNILKYFLFFHGNKL